MISRTVPELPCAICGAMAKIIWCFFRWYKVQRCGVTECQGFCSCCYGATERRMTAMTTTSNDPRDQLVFTTRADGTFTLTHGRTDCLYKWVKNPPKYSRLMVGLLAIGKTNVLCSNN